MNLLLALSLSPNYEKKKNTMSTLLNRLTLLVSFAYSALCLQAADKKPFGLMTDLIEHTGQTWQNGYASNLPVWQLEEAIEPFQYADNSS